MLNLEKIPTPLNGYVLVKPEPLSNEVKSTGGLYMPTNQKTMSDLVTAEIVCYTGTKLRCEQSVLMIRQSGMSIMINGEEHLLIKEEHLLAVV